MCVSLLVRVKQGKSNIILILILSARSQDRDREWYVNNKWKEFQSTRSQDRDGESMYKEKRNYEFQSTRSQDRDDNQLQLLFGHGDFNPLGRKTETYQNHAKERQNKISIHSVARPRLFAMYVICIRVYFNPLGRKTETISRISYRTFPLISIHSVARPRQQN